MTLRELREQAYAAPWDEFFAYWLPLLRAANESKTTRTYCFGCGLFTYLHTYYVDIDHCDVWVSCTP